MALLDGFGVAPPEEHINIVMKLLKVNAYSYLTWGGVRSRPGSKLIYLFIYFFFFYFI